MRKAVLMTAHGKNLKVHAPLFPNINETDPPLVADAYIKLNISTDSQRWTTTSVNPLKRTKKFQINKELGIQSNFNLAKILKPRQPFALSKT